MPIERAPRRSRVGTPMLRAAEYQPGYDGLPAGGKTLPPFTASPTLSLLEGRDGCRLASTGIDTRLS